MMCVTLGQCEPRLSKMEPPSQSYKNKSSVISNMLKKKKKSARNMTEFLSEPLLHENEH